ncbi:MAG: allophanate hydrolase [Clostridiales Family XIII bacterium]|jgi:biotin-dependent carboxylase-like uncharacterized protein|nr:allophanate hydrolase [Clostridiales Family XIII bacterium]
MIKVLHGGLQTLVEDWPGRLGYNGQGMSASGALDNRALQLGNLLLGNSLGEAGIEIAAGLFKCEFEEDSIIAITGADMKPTLGNAPVPLWESIFVKKGDVLSFGNYDPEQNAFRAYLCVAGGIDVEPYLGSKSTCVFGNYGGYEGRGLKPNDIVKVGGSAYRWDGRRRIRKDAVACYENPVRLRAIAGMNATPDFATERGMNYLFSHEFQASLNANRSAVRLDALPDWFFSRESGGVGGSHPSNIVDHAYNIRGGLNITGNTPSLLTADGPTLGGFICSINVINADLWKIGQVIPGASKILFEQVSQEEATALRKEARDFICEDIVESVA